MSLIPPHEKEDILLPSNVKVIKDLHFSPSNGSLALFASLGQKLSVLRCGIIYIIFFLFLTILCVDLIISLFYSLESNNIVLTYDLPVKSQSIMYVLVLLTEDADSRFRFHFVLCCFRKSIFPISSYEEEGPMYVMWLVAFGYLFVNFYS